MVAENIFMGLESREDDGYNNLAYQRAAEIDCWDLDGMSLEERYQREADFALRASGLVLDERCCVLDIACGAGGHSRRMATLTGMQVDARDISEPLLGLAQQKEIEEQLVDPTRRSIDFRLGDMLEIKKSLSEVKKYDLITILGSSFAYLHSREAYVRVLSEYLTLLRDGGKIVVQFRVYKPDVIVSLPSAHLQPNLSQVLAPRRKKSTVWSYERRIFKGKEVVCTTITDNVVGDRFFYVSSPPKIVDPTLNPVWDSAGRLMDLVDRSGTSVVESRMNDGTVFEYFTSDGILIRTFHRVYEGRGGKLVDLGATNFDGLSTQIEGLELLQSFFVIAGFQNVHLDSEVLSPDGRAHQLVVVGQK